MARSLQYRIVTGLPGGGRKGVGMMKWGSRTPPGPRFSVHVSAGLSIQVVLHDATMRTRAIALQPEDRSTRTTRPVRVPTNKGVVVFRQCEVEGR